MVERRQMGPLEDDPRASAAAVKKHRCWWSILMWAALATLHAQFTGVGGLKNVRVVSPGAVAVGETAALECQYDLEGAELYAVKWYKGKKEFYRYLPKEDPPSKVFPLPGINVDLSESDAHHVVLRDAGFTLTGRYRCEVSADAPSFDTALVVASLVIVDAEGNEGDAGEEKAEINSDMAEENVEGPNSEEDGPSEFDAKETLIMEPEDGNKHRIRSLMATDEIEIESVGNKTEELNTDKEIGRKRRGSEGGGRREEGYLEDDRKVNIKCAGQETGEGTGREYGMRAGEVMGLEEYGGERADELEGEDLDEEHGSSNMVKWRNGNIPGKLNTSNYQNKEEDKMDLGVVEENNFPRKTDEIIDSVSQLNNNQAEKGGSMGGHDKTPSSADGDERNEESIESFKDKIRKSLVGIDLYERALRYSEALYEVITSVLEEAAVQMVELKSSLETLKEEIAEASNDADKMAQAFKDLENVEPLEGVKMDEQNEFDVKGISKSIKGMQINGRGELKANDNDVINYSDWGKEEGKLNSWDMEKTEGREGVIDFYEDIGELRGVEKVKEVEEEDGFDGKTFSYLPEVRRVSEREVKVDEGGAEDEKDRVASANGLMHEDEYTDGKAAKKIGENLEVHKRKETFSSSHVKDEEMVALEEDKPNCESQMNCAEAPKSENEWEDERGEGTLEGSTENTKTLAKEEEEEQVRCNARYENESMEMGVGERREGSSLSTNDEAENRNKKGIEAVESEMQYVMKGEELGKREEKKTESSLSEEHRETEKLSGGKWNNKGEVKKSDRVEDGGTIISTGKGEDVKGKDVDSLGVGTLEEGIVEEEKLLEEKDYQINESEEKGWNTSTPQWKVQTRNEEDGGEEGEVHEEEFEGESEELDGMGIEVGRRFEMGGDEETQKVADDTRGMLMGTCYTKDNCDRGVIEQEMKVGEKESTEGKPDVHYRVEEKLTTVDQLDDGERGRNMKIHGEFIHEITEGKYIHKEVIGKDEDLELERRVEKDSKFCVDNSGKDGKEKSDNFKIIKKEDNSNEDFGQVANGEEADGACISEDSDEVKNRQEEREDKWKEGMGSGKRERESVMDTALEDEVGDNDENTGQRNKEIEERETHKRDEKNVETDEKMNDSIHEEKGENIQGEMKGMEVRKIAEIKEKEEEGKLEFTEEGNDIGNASGCNGGKEDEEFNLGEEEEIRGEKMEESGVVHSKFLEETGNTEGEEIVETCGEIGTRCDSKERKVEEEGNGMSKCESVGGEEGEIQAVEKQGREMVEMNEAVDELGEGRKGENEEMDYRVEEMVEVGLEETVAQVEEDKVEMNEADDELDDGKKGENDDTDNRVEEMVEVGLEETVAKVEEDKVEMNEADDELADGKKGENEDTDNRVEEMVEVGLEETVEKVDVGVAPINEARRCLVEAKKKENEVIVFCEEDRVEVDEDEEAEMEREEIVKITESGLQLLNDKKGENKKLEDMNEGKVEIVKNETVEEEIEDIVQRNEAVHELEKGKKEWNGKKTFLEEKKEGAAEEETLEKEGGEIANVVGPDVKEFESKEAIKEGDDGREREEGKEKLEINGDENEVRERKVEERLRVDVELGSDFRGEAVEEEVDIGRKSGWEEEIKKEDREEEDGDDKGRIALSAGGNENVEEGNDETSGYNAEK